MRAARAPAAVPRGRLPGDPAGEAEAGREMKRGRGACACREVGGGAGGELGGGMEGALAGAGMGDGGAGEGGGAGTGGGADVARMGR